MYRYRSVSILLLVISWWLSSTTRAHAQNFYKDHIRFSDSLTKTNTLADISKYHRFHGQFAKAYKQLFRKVKDSTGYDMLRYNELYTLEVITNFYAGGYYMLIWNKDHTCYYENPSSSPELPFLVDSLKFKVDAIDLMSLISPRLKGIVESGDTLAFRKYFLNSSTIDLSKRSPVQGIRMTKAVKMKDHWTFLSSQTFSFIRSD